ncbi:probable ATP-dependent RNA helicase DDX28 [Condylostylus longicornis]|uniref:probable ATP-dependent RNA helicase DDX28 n=1 Tax=Condylostylus longicornis TaxID=2530218 RepID=UPI00244E3D92|nr:probable ATP-dependent RNA helicase DDX28 [Condylostylus longicornis]
MIRKFSTALRPSQIPRPSIEKPLITCKNARFNLYLSHVRDTKVKFKSIPLASDGWYHRKSKGDFFLIHPTVEGILENAYQVSSISNEINSEILKNLENEFEIENLTDIQVKSIPQIISGNHVLIAAETGCGKTLAYLIPIIQNILNTKEKLKSRKLNSPLAMILTPGRELATQISEVVSKLTKNTDLKVKAVLGGNTKQQMKNPEFEDIDIFVGTMGATTKLVTTGIYRINEVRHVVLDEADTLLDNSFKEKLNIFLKKFPFYKISSELKNSNEIATQLILVSATMPTNLRDLLLNIIDTETIYEVVSPNLHKLLPHVQQKFLRMNKSDRPAALVSLVKSELNKNRPIIVFANKTPTSDFVSIFLNESGVNCINLNGDMLMKVRIGRFEQFQKGNVDVLATTDVASRGLDTKRARHVINFDFPIHMSDYIHRCGRIGRVGTLEKCFVTNYISGRSEISTVQRIEHAARTGGYLPNVDANITQIIEQKILKELGDIDESTF